MTWMRKLKSPKIAYRVRQSALPATAARAPQEQSGAMGSLGIAISAGSLYRADRVPCALQCDFEAIPANLFPLWRRGYRKPRRPGCWPGMGCGFQSNPAGWVVS
jgi:hypothetical protein